MHSALYDRMLDTQQFSYFSFHSFLKLPSGVFVYLAVCMLIIPFSAEPAKIRRRTYGISAIYFPRYSA
jgi:hypothetical protein